MIPKLYYQVDSKGYPVRAYDIYAAIGALEFDIQVSKYQFIDDVVYDPYKIVVGSVENLQKYLNCAGVKLPDDIDLTLFTSFMNRRFEKIYYHSIPRLNYPCFIKPVKAKAFEAGIYKDFDSALNFIPKSYIGEFYYSEVRNYKSEWRVYVNNGKIIKVCHYLGNPLIFPHSHIINSIVNYAETVINNHSYTVDVGVLVDSDGRIYGTDLIELNDGWAIGNYGLEPKEYYLFLRDRWLQITGVRIKKDFKV